MVRPTKKNTKSASATPVASEGGAPAPTPKRTAKGARGGARSRSSTPERSTTPAPAPVEAAPAVEGGAPAPAPVSRKEAQRLKVIEEIQNFRDTLKTRRETEKEGYKARVEAENTRHREALQALRTEHTERMSLLTDAEKMAERSGNLYSKLGSKRATGGAKRPARVPEYRLSADMAEFMGSETATRSGILRRVSEYAKANSLNEGKVINRDATLSGLFTDADLERVSAENLEYSVLMKILNKESRHLVEKIEAPAPEASA